MEPSKRVRKNIRITDSRAAFSSDEDDEEEDEAEDGSDIDERSDDDENAGAFSPASVVEVEASPVRHDAANSEGEAGSDGSILPDIRNEENSGGEGIDVVPVSQVRKTRSKEARDIAEAARIKRVAVAADRLDAATTRDQEASASTDLITAMSEADDDPPAGPSSTGHPGETADSSVDDLQAASSQGRTIYATLAEAREAAWALDLPEVQRLREAADFTSVDQSFDVGDRLNIQSARMHVIREVDARGRLQVVDDLSDHFKKYVGSRTWKLKQYMLVFRPSDHAGNKYMSGMAGLHSPESFGKFRVEGSAVPVRVGSSQMRKSNQLLVFCPWCDHWTTSQTSLCSHVLGHHYYLGLLCHYCKILAYTDSTLAYEHDQACTVGQERRMVKARKEGARDKAKDPKDPKKGPKKTR